MRGTERVNGELRYYYQYKPTGPKFYYKPRNHGGLRIPFKRPFIPKQEWSPPHEHSEYIPQPPRLSKLEQQFQLMHPNIQKLVNQWLLIFGFQTINQISTDAMNKMFRQLSLKHHPDRGGNSEMFKELSNVRDHLTTLCSLADAMK